MKYLNELGSKAAETFKRFPLPCLWAFFGSFFLIGVLQAGGTDFFESYRNEIFTLSLGISWLMATKFFIEQFTISARWWFLNLLTLALLLFYYLSLPEYSPENSQIHHIRWFLYLLAGHVFLFFAPFVKHWNSAAFWNYLKNIFISLGRSILFSGVLYLGLVFAMLAIDSLFNIRIQGKVYGQVFIFCLGIVNTGVYLSDFPRNIQEDLIIHYNKPLEVFVKFILTPLIGVYLLILYLYSFKIIVEWELPEGWVSSMITVLALLGFIIHIIIEPIQRDHPSFLLRKFFPMFYLLLAPMMILLFVAVFRRISDYNFTESRYFLMLLSFWILGILAYLLLSKKKQLRILPISLFLLIVLGSFGPWGAFQISAEAQASEFREIINEIDPNNKELSEEKANRIIDISRYLVSRNQLHKTEAVLGFNPEIAFAEHSDYNIGNKILDSLQIKTIMGKELRESWQQFNRNSNEPVMLDLDGYDKFTDLQFDQSFSREENSPVQVLYKKENLQIATRGEILLQFNLEEKLINTIQKYGNLYNADPNDLELVFNTEKGKFKLILTNLIFQMEDGKPQLQHLSGYLFYRLE